MNSSIYLQMFRNKTESLASYAIILMAVMHLAGFIGLQLSYTRSLFEMLVPFNLISTTLIVFYFHRDWSTKFWIFVVFTFSAGFFVEVLGVHTKVIFGDYFYEGTLGYKIFNVPLTIGLNWLVLIYATGNICLQVNIPKLFKPWLAALLMVFLDVFIEPVAIFHNFWEWRTDFVPLQNYLAWYFISVVLLYIYYFLPFDKKNPTAKSIYFIQLAFFFAHFISYV